jgi:diguanylate cyclase (GGDEF)-like protein
MDIAALNSTKTLRKHVLKWMCICFGFLSLVFAVFNLSVNNLHLVGGLEVGFSLLCLYIFKHSQKHYPKRWHAIIMCLAISLIVLCGTYLAPLKNGLFLWTFILPILYYLLLGRRYGLILSSALLGLQLLVLSQKLPYSSFAAINLGLNLLFVYISLWAISHVFEGNRADFSKRLKNLALLDPLTGAGNRLSMNHYFEVELRDKSQLYLFLLDLDYFKQINDQYGHEVGDKVLVELATLLRVTFAKGYVFRVGGEEFSLMSNFDSPQAALAMAEKLRLAIQNKQIVANGETIKLTASVGVVQYQHQSLSELIDLADKQLYKAKETGRNEVCTDILALT